MKVKISVPGTYLGYTSAVADGYRRDSRYFQLKDGCRLAYDTYLPTHAGALPAERFPTLLVATGYRRAWPYSRNDAAKHVARRYPHLEEGEVATYVNHVSKLPDGVHSQWIDGAPDGDLDTLAEWVRQRGSSSEYLLLHGFAFVVLDVRGTGASFGTNFSDGWQAGKDISEFLEFLVTQDWCDGNIGMIGCSWHGASQYFTMTYGSAHLKAAMPQMAGYDAYFGWYPGGAYLSGFLRQWSKRRVSEDREQAALPVNDDREGVLLAQALEERKNVTYPTDEELGARRSAPSMPAMARDELLQMFPLQKREHADGSLVDLQYQALDFQRAARNGTAVYFYAGWFDMFPRDVIIAYWNYAGPKKMIIGPWHHNNYWDREEARRWFDYWLRGIDNGIMGEASFVYSTQSVSSKAIGWNGTDTWPLSIERRTSFFLIPAPEGSHEKRPGGGLEADPPRHSAPPAALTVDYSASAGKRTRTWYHGGPHLDYSALADNSRRGLTWISPPLSQDTEITGHPELTVYFSSTEPGGIVVAYLEAVDQQGRGELLTEVVLNLEFRRVQTEPPIEHKALTYRSYDSSTRIAVVPGEVMEIRTDMLPAACLVERGYRLKLTIHGADRDNFYAREFDPPPVYKFYCDADHPSRLVLPLVAQDARRDALRIPGAFSEMPERSRFAVKRGG